MRRLLMSGAIASACAGVASAQVVHPVEFKGQSTMNAAGGITTGCGIRFVGSKAFHVGKALHGDVVDASITVFSAGFGAVKGGWQVVQIVDGKPIYSPSDGVVSWLRVDGAPPLAAADGQSFKAETAGYTMYSADLSDTTKSQSNFIGGSNLRIAFVKPDGAVVIFSGSLSIDDEAREQVALCFRSLLADANAAAKER